MFKKKLKNVSKPVESSRHDVHSSDGALALVGVDVRIGEIFVPDVLRRLSRDGVLVEAGQVLDELRVGQDPLRRAPEVVDHLAARGGVGYSIWKKNNYFTISIVRGKV